MYFIYIIYIAKDIYCKDKYIYIYIYIYIYCNRFAGNIFFWVALENTHVNINFIYETVRQDKFSFEDKTM